MLRHPTPARRADSRRPAKRATLREVLAYNEPSNARTEWSDIDREVVEMCRSTADLAPGRFDDPRVRTVYDDGPQVRCREETATDVVISDVVE